MWALLSTRNASTPSMPSSAGPIGSPPLVVRASPSDDGPDAAPPASSPPQAANENEQDRDGQREGEAAEHGG